MNVSIFCCSSETILKHIRFYQHNPKPHHKLKQLWDSAADVKKKKGSWQKGAYLFFSCGCQLQRINPVCVICFDSTYLGAFLSFFFFCLNETRGCFCSQKHHYGLCSEELELKIVNHLCQNDTWIEKQRGSRELLEAKPL